MNVTKKGFTLAEVLITLAIIGVVAAISIPSVVANTQQKEFQTGLRKAVSVLNSAITMNMAIDGESPYETNDLYSYMGRHMAVMKTAVASQVAKGTTLVNLSFYTTDGMRFEFVNAGIIPNSLKLHENSNVKLRGSRNTFSYSNITGDVSSWSTCRNVAGGCSYCGSYGLNNNFDNTINPPCLVVVDVNGDRKPFPKNASCFKEGANECGKENVRKYADVNGIKLTDTFSIMITDKQAVPFGVAAQRAMYQAQSREKK